MRERVCVRGIKRKERMNGHLYKTVKRGRLPHAPHGSTIQAELKLFPPSLAPREPPRPAQIRGCAGCCPSVKIARLVMGSRVI